MMLYDIHRIFGKMYDPPTNPTMQPRSDAPRNRKSTLKMMALFPKPSAMSVPSCVR